MMMDGKGPVYDFSIGNPDLEPPRKFRDVLRRIAADETPGQHKYQIRGDSSAQVELRLQLNGVSDALLDQLLEGIDMALIQSLG